MPFNEKESVSALLDNEANDLELPRLLKSLGADSSLLETWDRYNLVQAVLHDQPVCKASPKLSQKIFKALQSEQIDAVPTTAQLNSEESDSKPDFKWQQTLVKMAIAASVTVAAVIVLQTGNNPATPSLVQQEESLMVPVQQNLAGITVLAGTSAESNRQVDPLAQQRLREYIESVSIDQVDPQQFAPLQDSPLYRLVNELQELESKQ